MFALPSRTDAWRVARQEFMQSRCRTMATTKSFHVTQSETYPARHVKSHTPDTNVLFKGCIVSFLLNNQVKTAEHQQLVNGLKSLLGQVDFWYVRDVLGTISSVLTVHVLTNFVNSCFLLPWNAVFLECRHAEIRLTGNFVVFATAIKLYTPLRCHGNSAHTYRRKRARDRPRTQLPAVRPYNDKLSLNIFDICGKLSVIIRVLYLSYL